jgi:hypothetical protein
VRPRTHALVSPTDAEQPRYTAFKGTRCKRALGLLSNVLTLCSIAIIIPTPILADPMNQDRDSSTVGIGEDDEENSTLLSSYLPHDIQQAIPGLPSDVLLPIFELACHNSHAVTAALALSHVSHDWRAAALAHKPLWTTVELSNPRLATEFMDRSHPAGFVLHLHQREQKGDLEGMADALKYAIRQSHRIEEIIVRTHESLDIVAQILLPIVQNESPTFINLRRLVVNSRWESTQEPTYLNTFPPHGPNVAALFQHGLPALRHITLAGCFAPSASFTHCAPTHVQLDTIGADHASFRAFLRHAAPSLEVLGATLPGPLAMSLAGAEDAPALAFPRLRVLRLAGVFPMVLFILVDAVIPITARVELRDAEPPSTLVLDIEPSDELLPTLADIISHRYGGSRSQYAITWAAGDIRIAALAHSGSLHIAGTGFDLAEFAELCGGLAPGLRTRVAVLRVEDTGAGPLEASFSARAPWYALTQALPRVRTLHVAGHAAAVFLRAHLMIGDPAFFAEVDVLRVSGCEDYADLLRYALGAVLERAPPFSAVHFDGEVGPLGELGSVAARVGVMLFHDGQRVLPEHTVSLHGQRHIEPGLCSTCSVCS